MTTVRVSQNDVGVRFEDLLVADGLEDLDDVTEVLFLMRKVGDPSTIVVGTGLVVDPDTRDIGYATQDDDLAVAGWYEQAWQLTFSSGEVYTFMPDSGGYNSVHVVADLGP